MSRRRKRPRKSTETIDAKTIETMAMFAIVPIVALTLIRCMMPSEPSCCDSYYMLKTGRQILEGGHIPNHMPTPYGDIPTTWQNWLACVAYALAMNAGEAVGIGHIAVSATHTVSVATMIATVIVVARRNRISRLETALAVTMAVMQYSITQTRVHALMTTCLLICCEAAMSTMHDRKRRRAWQIAAIVACVIATNIQHMLAIAMPMAIAGIGVLTQGAQRRQRVETLAFACLALATTVLMAPPEAGGIVEGLAYRDDSSTINELLSIPERIAMSTTPEDLYGEILILMRVVMVAISATIIATRREKNLPLAIMVLAATVMSFKTVRNQQMLCALMTACVLCQGKETTTTRYKTWQAPLLLCLISMFMSSLVLIPSNVQKMKDPNEFVRLGGETRELGFFNEIMADVPKKSTILIGQNMEMGSWLYANGYMPSKTSKSETMGQDETEARAMDVRWDFALLYETDPMVKTLEQTHEWKVTNTLYLTKRQLCLLKNDTGKTLREQTDKRQ